MEEIWKPILGYEGIYEVSNLGRVRTCLNIRIGHYKPGKVFNLPLSKNGYLMIGLWRNRKRNPRTVHSLVLESFFGPRPMGFVCRHLDGNKTNNSIGNLAWGTYEENSEDRKGHGTANAGIRHGMSKLTDEIVLRIREMAGCGTTNRLIAQMFNLTPSNVGYIVKRKTWTRI